MKALVIPAADGEPMRVEEVPRIDLAFLQGLVGGTVEHIHLEPDSGLGMYLNEEGKLEGLELNVRATILARLNSAIHTSDYIVGNAVLVGPVDARGYETGLTDEHLADLSMVFEVVADMLGAEEG